MILGPFSVIKRKSRICHCEHLKGAWQSDEVVARAKPAAIPRDPSLGSGQGLLRFTRNDILP
jgi:hypothetical protein